MGKSVIHKYVLEAQPGKQKLKLPQEAEFLKADIQGANIVIWYRIPLSMLDTSDVKILDLRWTGKMYDHYVTSDKYLDTVTHLGLVYHIYDITTRE